MSKHYGGPLGWLRKWNARRMQKRRWQRQVLEALANDDEAIMKALSSLLEQSSAEAAARASGLAALDQRLDGLNTVLDQKLDGLNTVLDQKLDGLNTVLDQKLDGLNTVLDQKLTAHAAHGFPLIPTAREGLLEPELEVLAHIASDLSPKVAIDVGAHHGRFSAALLNLGFEVHALEPNPEVLAELMLRLGDQPGMTIHGVAAGAEEGQAVLTLVADASGQYSDVTQLASLCGLPPSEGLVSAGTVRVPMRRLDALVRDHGLAVPSFVKVDTEGYDLEVLRGLGSLWPEVLMAEFWDDAFPMASSGTRNRLTHLVAHARTHGASSHLVVFRRWGDDRPAFYANYSASPERSWGNVLFFKDPSLFEEARQHLATLLPEARFVAAPKP